MKRRPGPALMIAIAVLSSASGTLEGQSSIQRWNAVLTESTIDAASVGIDDRLALEINETRTIAAGLRLGDGSLRATYAGYYKGPYIGIGYARQFIARATELSATLGLGMDLLGAYDFSAPTSTARRAVQLTMPVSLSWGRPGRSLAPFAGAFGEIGSDRYYVSPPCPSGQFCGSQLAGLAPTRGLGFVTGVDATFWRLGLQSNYQRFVGTMNPSGSWRLGLGFRVRL